MRSAAIFAFVAAAGTLFVACGGSTGGGLTTRSDAGGKAIGDGGGGSGATASQACASVAKARCQKRDSCTNGVDNKVRYGDEPTCESRETANCIAALAASGTSATPAFFEGCGTALTNETCSDFLGVNVPDACSVVPGKDANGAACVFDAQCQSTYCAIPTSAACGTCAPIPKAGDSCAATRNCGRGLYCTKDTSVCTAPVAQGGTCAKDEACGAGLSCVGEVKNGAKTCQPIAAAVGAACDSLERTGPGCDRTLGLFCNDVSKKCEAASFANPGQPCGVVRGGFAVCSGGTCEMPTTVAVTGTCAAAAADGAPCDTAKGDVCLAPARCIVAAGATAGTCKVPDPTACR